MSKLRKFFKKISQEEQVDQTHGVIQDLNLGGHMNVSSRWSIRNIKKYCR